MFDTLNSVERTELISSRSRHTEIRRKPITFNTLRVLRPDSFQQIPLDFCFIYATILGKSVLSVSHLRPHSIANPCRYLRF
jgi:hypothetical protein